MKSLSALLVAGLLPAASFAVDAPLAPVSLVDPATVAQIGTRSKSGYELVFSDEFEADELSADRWSTQLRWDGDWNGERFEYRTINDEAQFYVNIFSDDDEHLEKVAPVYNPFKMNGETLSITATVNPLKTRDGDLSYGKLDDMVAQQEFLSGVISTSGKFARKYGIFEARIKIPDADGTFPAFWLYHERSKAEGTQKTEIDVMENLGHAPWYIYNSFHYFKNVTEYTGGDANFIKPSPNGQIYTGTDYSEDFHVYAVKWQPGRIEWMIDGQVVSTVENDNANFEELHMQINLAMGGKWANYPTNAGGMGRTADRRYPNDEDVRNFTDPALEIDFVRVFAPL